MGRGTAVAPEATRAQGGVPDPTPEVEEEMEVPLPGGDATGHGRVLTTETGTARETGIGDDTRHAGGQGPVPAHGRGAVPGEGPGAVETTGG